MLQRLLLVSLLALTACPPPRAPAPATGPSAPAQEAAPQTPAAEPAGEQRRPIRLTLIGTNDFHGWVYPHRAVRADGTVLEEGGPAVFAGYLSILRADNPGGTLLLDGGDLFQGTLASNLTEGAVVIDVFNHLGYTAVALGNHEFDYGPVGPAPVAIEPSQDPFGALKARIKQARFPLLAVNVYLAATGERPAWMTGDGTMMVEVKGVRVGLLGLITPNTPQTTNPVNVATLRFGSLVPEAIAAAKRLRDQGAELVVAVAHAGGKCASAKDPRDLSTCDLENGEVFELMRGVPEGTLDAVIAGHTHAALGHYVQGTPVIETTGLGRTFGIIELFVDPSSRKVLTDRTVIRPNIPICARIDELTSGCSVRQLREASEVKLVDATFMGKPVVKDAQLEAMIAPAIARVEVEQRRKLGIRARDHFGRNYEAESALGSMLADTLRELEKADVALLNSGGLRADLRAGELTYGDVYEVIPFDNTIATVSVNGEELKRLLHAAYSSRKGVFQVSGLKVTVAPCPGQGRLRSFTMADGKPPRPDRTYRVVMPDFLARGGDGLGAVLASLPPGRIDFGDRRPLNFRDALVDHWQRRRPELTPPAPGRIQFSEPAGSCNPGSKMDMHRNGG